MSSTLLAMKEIMEKNGMLEKHKQSKSNMDMGVAANVGNGKDSNQLITSQLASETTIYRNVLQMDNIGSEEGIKDSVDDPEITFKTPVKDSHKAMQNNSSSEEQVDTSDEMLDLEVDINEKFIADCAHEAAANREPGPHEKAADLIKQA